MAKGSAAAVKRRDSPLSERLNGRVLQTIRELAIYKSPEDSLADEYDAELFGRTGPATPKPKIVK